MADTNSLQQQQLQTIEPTASTFACKSTIIYGASGSGKSTMVRHIMYLLRDTIHRAIAFSASEVTNGNYSRHLIPRQFVYDNIDANTIASILRHQTRAVEIHKHANDMGTLETLSARCATRDEQCAIDAMRAVYAQMVRESGGNESPEIRETYESRYSAFLRKIIAAHLPQLKALIRDQHTTCPLSKNEVFAVNWFAYVPDLLVVIDDCTESLGKLKTSSDLQALLFRGRHFKITTIITAHGDTFMHTSWRANSAVSIFTSGAVAIAYGQKTSNGVTNRALFTQYVSNIKTEPPHTKLMLLEQQPYLFVAREHPAFSAVSQAVRDFAEKIERKSDTSWMDGL